MSPTLGQLVGETLWISRRSDMTRSRERISGEQETQIGTWNFPLSRISQWLGVHAQYSRLAAVC
ncbi:hypothetical protein N657DRAFT_639440 [Parathielavia appendiculata]|uniref:Uncharacterized protein n=1 Tax=Parathielavia appendiculata TaxID=2587402 RepID=A0AAN6U9J5_9PEZI|nr:hypothetical protein N657DRAFT_639440 [Parathielavia appendiculata]